MGLSREPYWVSKKELAQLDECIKNISEHSEISNAIRQEVAVASTRRDTYRSIHALVIALGLSRDSIPLYLNEDEVAFLNNLNELPAKIKGRLS